MKTRHCLFFLFTLVGLLGCHPIRRASVQEPPIENRSVHLTYELDDESGFLVYSGYVVKYNIECKCPQYTIHRLTSDQIDPQLGEAVPRRSSFFVDDAKLGNQSATSRDYKGSGFDRGHMVPAGDFVWDKPLKDETFSYANISPQNPSLNRGIWAHLEEKVRQTVLSTHDTAFVVTGCVNGQQVEETIGPDSVCVPDLLCKIVFLNRTHRMYAYVFDNLVQSYSGTLCDYQVRARDVETLSGVDFFEALDDTLEERLEMSKDCDLE